MCNANEQTTTTCNNMDGYYKNHAERKKARQREVHIFWFHSHKLQKQAKSIYSVRNQDSGYLRNKGLEICIRQRGDLKGAGHVLFLDLDAY